MSKEMKLIMERFEAFTKGQINEQMGIMPVTTGAATAVGAARKAEEQMLSAIRQRNRTTAQVLYGVPVKENGTTPLTLDVGDLVFLSQVQAARVFANLAKKGFETHYIDRDSQNPNEHYPEESEELDPDEFYKIFRMDSNQLKTYPKVKGLLDDIVDATGGAPGAESVAINPQVAISQRDPKGTGGAHPDELFDVHIEQFRQALMAELRAAGVL